MQLILNELSFYPLSENGKELEDKFEVFFKSFNEAKKSYMFNHVSFPQSYNTIMATSNQNFHEWVISLNNRKTKEAILTFFKKPFVDELNDSESEEYFNSDYRILEDGVPTSEEPIGLVVASIKKLPAASIDCDLFWRKTKIIISKIIDDVIQDEFLIAYNICLEGSFKTNEIQEWADNCYSSHIEDEERLKLYLKFSKYTVSFQNEFMQQFLKWKSDDFEKFKYLLLLMKDVHNHPFTGGMGQTENLTKRGKEASKRVTFEDRLSYTLEKDHVNFIACKGHYKFH